MKIFLTLATLLSVQSAWGQFDPHFIDSRQGIVHLFEWKWLDIAKECEDFLGPKGYGGVQTSPANENAIVAGRPWFERYQPMSFKLETRSGTESEFKEMVERCRNVGVRIFVDVVVNHMAPPGVTAPVNGTAGSQADPLARYFPAVPFNRTDFHPACEIENYGNATEVRVCELASLPDLNQGNPVVREKIIEYMNHLIDLGVAGFRMDACKHMYPADLRVIYGSLKPLSSANGFINGTRAFVYQEVIDLGNESVRRQEYTTLGTVTEFTYSAQIGMVFRKDQRDLSALQRWGVLSGFLPSRYSFVFVDNHDNQRGHGAGGSTILTYKQKNLYTKAVAFMLAHPHGGNHPRVMSSFYFDDPSQGPPQDTDGNIVSRGVDENGNCTNGWVCEHRWAPIANMVKFRAVTDGTLLRLFTNIAQNQISFCRGNRGFVAINNADQTLNATVNACVPDGYYCDVISGDVVNGKCSGKTVYVKGGKARVELETDSAGVLAIHVGAKPTICSCSQVEQFSAPVGTRPERVPLEPQDLPDGAKDLNDNGPKDLPKPPRGGPKVGPKGDFVVDADVHVPEVPSFESDSSSRSLESPEEEPGREKREAEDDSDSESDSSDSEEDSEETEESEKKEEESVESEESEGSEASSPEEPEEPEGEDDDEDEPEEVETTSVYSV